MMALAVSHYKGFARGTTGGAVQEPGAKIGVGRSKRHDVWKGCLRELKSPGRLRGLVDMKSYREAGSQIPAGIP